jgi:hypothetical protein
MKILIRKLASLPGKMDGMVLLETRESSLRQRAGWAVFRELQASDWRERHEARKA